MPADVITPSDVELAGEPAGSGPVPAPDGDRPSPAPRRPGRRTKVGAVVAVFCVYEVTAETLNRFLDIDLLPSITGWVRRWSAAGVARAMGPPSWMRNTAILDLGFMVHVMGTGRRRRRGGRG